MLHGIYIMSLRQNCHLGEILSSLVAQKLSKWHILWSQWRYFVSCTTFSILWYIPRIALSCFIVFCCHLVRGVYPYHSGLPHWHWGKSYDCPMLVKQPWRIWIKLIIWIKRSQWYNHNKSPTKACVYFVGYTSLDIRSNSRLINCVNSCFVLIFTQCQNVM